MGDSDDLDQMLDTAFPDDVERAKKIRLDALQDPRLTEEVMRTARFPAAKRDLKDAVDRAYGRWQAKQAEEAVQKRQEQAEGIIRQRVINPFELRGHALELIRANPDFVDSVLRLPTDEREFLLALASAVDGMRKCCQTCSHGFTTSSHTVDQVSRAPLTQRR
jgi:hypothetical protein